MRHVNGGSEGEKLRRRKRGSVDCKSALMDAVVSLTASSGIESLSTRAIVGAARDVSTDAYIYTIFGSKENLLSEVFLREDARYKEAMERSLPVLLESGLPFESRLRHLWHTMWSRLTVTNPEACLFLTRYLCSAFFTDGVGFKHHETWRPVSEKLHILFPDTDADRLTETVELFLLNIAAKAIMDNSPDSSVISENGFLMLSGLLNYWHYEERRTG